MKAWVTKWALSSGIIEVDGEITSSGCLRYKSGEFTGYVFGNDFHQTKESAIARAEEMRIRKLKSLDKQIKKVSALKFD